MDPHTANLLGALATGCFDVQTAAMLSPDESPADLAALLAAHTRPGSTVSDVASSTGLTHSGAVRAIDRLSHAGAVERRTGRDRRTVALHCTKQGESRARSALTLRQEALESVLAPLTTRETATLKRLMTKLLSGLPSNRKDAWRICRLCDHGACRGADCPVGSAVDE